MIASTSLLKRRTVLAGLGAGGLLGGCDTVGNSPLARSVLFRGEDMHRSLQRLVGDRAALAPQFTAADLSPIFRANGTRNPNTPQYNAWVANGFADWRLQVGGMVARPLSLGLTELFALPQRVQITRHDCVEGWSAIGKWQGPQLATVLRATGVSGHARYIVFHCADRYGANPYYESVDMIDAWHPQTILALGLNDRRLDVAHGAPVRLRVERQLGYKHAKYLTGIEAVASLDQVGRGKGGFWEDHHDYDWYAGI